MITILLQIVRFHNHREQNMYKSSFPSAHNTETKDKDNQLENSKHFSTPVIQQITQTYDLGPRMPQAHFNPPSSKRISRDGWTRKGA